PRIPHANLTAFEQINTIERRRRFNLNAEFPPARRIESGAFELRADLRPHPVDERQKDLCQKIERWRERVMRPAFQHERAVTRSHHQRRQHRLKHERRAPRRAYGKSIVAGSDLAGSERKLLRADAVTAHFRLPDLRRGLHRRQMLAQQSRILPPRANLLDAERLPRDQSERERGTQYLPAAFPK